MCNAVVTDMRLNQNEVDTSLVIVLTINRLNHYVGPVMSSTSFVDHLCYLCLVFVMLLRLFIAALWSPAGKGMTSWILFVMSNCDFVTILGRVWYLIVLIPDLCRLS